MEPVSKPIAVFEDGSGAILENNYGKGKAYAFGIDIGKMLALGYNGKQSDLGRSSVNEYEPMLDVLLRLIREFYRETNGVTIGTCPDGKNLTVIITHDIDFNQSVINSLVYARFENEQNIKATYFMQTKYIKDWEDEPFFTSENNMILMELQLKKMEVASHSVSHSRSFNKFDRGDFEETQETYRPFVEEKFITRNGSVSGEIVVSKQLLDSSLNSNVVSFRPGYLSYPKILPQSLAKAGYKYSSSMTANEAITHFPFQLNYDRESITEVPIFEFPLTIEDNEENLMKHLPKYLDLAKQISNEAGIMVLLIHPNILGDKLEFEKKFYFEIKDKAVFKSIEEFGEWWSARNDVKIEVDGNKIILDSKKPIEGLTLLLPTGASLVVPILKDHLEIFYSIN
jgi:peptidoglycan/xylan/chitin deacetylase (PgdA/CDA1 family)